MAAKSSLQPKDCAQNTAKDFTVRTPVDQNITKMNFNANNTDDIFLRAMT